MSSGYIIAYVEVTNSTQYEEYKKWSTVAMQAHGAEVRAREPVSGVWCLVSERAQLRVARRVRERLDAGVQISQRHVARSPVFQLRRAQRAV